MLMSAVWINTASAGGTAGGFVYPNGPLGKSTMEFLDNTDIMKASKKEITLWDAENLKAADVKVGEAGSAIQILKVLAPKMDRKKIVVEAETVKEVADKLAKALLKEGVIGR